LARNGSGTMTVLHSFSAGSTIASAQVNANFTDFASEVTGSLPRNGEAGMTGQMKAASGTVAAPGVTFGADLDCGFYRIGADNVGLSLAGAKVVDYSATGVAVTGTFSASGASTLTGAVTASSTITATGAITSSAAISGSHGTVPVGAISDYAGSSAPTGWLLCYGQAVSRTTYALLFTAISTTYGVGDGSTTFTLPDCRGRTSAGKDDMGGSSANRLTNQSGGLDGDTLGATGGSETHTLLTAEMPAHTHQTNPATVGISYQSGASSAISGAVPLTAANTTSTGGGGAHNNVQPTIIFNKIIYAGV
jgi:microcystin-dependent protein